MNKKTPLYKETDLGGRLTPFQGKWPDIADSAYVFHGAQVVGDVSIAEHASIWHNCVLRGDVNHIKIGERSNIQDGTVIHVSTHTYPTLIGRDVLVAHMAMLHGCTLKDNAFVGMGAIVMDNTVIESDGMLAAGAMLTPGKTIKSGELWAGRPAKFVRGLRPEEIEKNRSMAEHYRRIAEQHKIDAKGETADEPYP
ncbi:gamma carbonic anhydrase family protein [Kordiimonas sp. SCSIO 12610]|uniref:gamma carbonic anhydrase family protein n=1 Tax=Kordiimonas sp. SCSIO 12610 TaxID=2829597 RepID=UPI00210CD5B7|nr:gamma carbonic anhydrase family protein [Kordiimonas sp. SCSIO 12610]UTW53921.1 gamma carbonic anhydrase family protein [Kordiimonas sp. SCSIO 12610]